MLLDHVEVTKYFNCICSNPGCHSTMSGEKRERWRKEWVRGGSGTPSPATAPLAAHPTHLLAAHLLHPPAPQGSPHLPPVHLEGALAADVSLTVLHTLETIVQVSGKLCFGHCREKNLGNNC